MLWLCHTSVATMSGNLITNEGLIVMMSLSFFFIKSRIEQKTVSVCRSNNFFVLLFAGLFYFIRGHC